MPPPQRLNNHLYTDKVAAAGGDVSVGKFLPLRSRKDAGSPSDCGQRAESRTPFIITGENSFFVATDNAADDAENNSVVYLICSLYSFMFYNELKNCVSCVTL